MHFATDFAPAERKADMALFLPANDFLTDARVVVANRDGISFAGMSNLTLGTRSKVGLLKDTAQRIFDGMIQIVTPIERQTLRNCVFRILE